MANPITFNILVHECGECKNVFTRQEWRIELNKKCAEFGEYEVWDSTHLCYDCYFKVHDMETAKDIWLNEYASPLKTKLVHGYECSDCKTAFTVEEWNYEQEQRYDDGESIELCYRCHDESMEMKNYARL